jgi:hypothetical protein
MLVETHRSLGNAFNPTSSDFEAYYRVVDQGRRGYVPRAEFENLVVRILCGTGSSLIVSTPTPITIVSQPIRTIIRIEIPIEVRRMPFYMETLDVTRMLFNKYDTDRSGYLNILEAMKFIEDFYPLLSKYTNNYRSFATTSELLKIFQ